MTGRLLEENARLIAKVESSWEYILKLEARLAEANAEIDRLSQRLETIRAYPLTDAQFDRIIEAVNRAIAPRVS